MHSRRGYMYLGKVMWVRCDRCGVGVEAYERSLVEEWVEKFRELVRLVNLEMYEPPEDDPSIPF